MESPEPAEDFPGAPGAAMAGPVAYRFGDYLLDVRQLTLTLDDRPVPLEPKAFEVLRLLIEHRDRLVTKDELLDTVWRGTFVTPNVLSRAVAQLRKALGDDAREARFIQTAATRGYRFIAPVVVNEPAVGNVPAVHESVAVAPVTVKRPSGRLVLAGALLLAVGIGGWRLLPLAIDDEAGPMQTRRLTSRNGYHGMAAISPDGGRIAYASERDTGLELVVSSLEAGSQEMTLTSDGGQHMQPEWSPDGAWLAFHSRKRGGIWIMPSGGGPARQVVDFGSAPTWSPDGERLAFSSDAGGMASQSVIWTVKRDGSDLEPVTTLGNPAGGHHDPAYHPAGRAVVFVARRGNWTQELWQLDTASGSRTRLASALSISEPRFGPAGRHIYWGAVDEKGIGRLWRLSMTETNAEPIPLLTLNAGAISGLSIAKSGTAVYSVTTSDSNLWTISATVEGGSEPTKLTDESGRVTYPDYSADGRIAYTHRVPGNPVAAWIISQDGQRRERLLPDMSVTHAQWLLDASRLLVAREDEGWTFLWVDAATRRTTPAKASIGGGQVARVSPDGLHLAYHVIQPDGVMNVFRTPLDGGPAVQLTHDSEAMSYPAWSRDARWLAIEIKRGDRTHIGVMPSAGGTVEQLTFGRGQSWPHSWAPDNERIAFAGQRDGVWNVWTVSRLTKQVRRLTNFVSAAGYVRYPSWSPAGDRLVFERAVEEASVWAVELR